MNRLLNFFRKPSPLEIAKHQLLEAKLSCLEALAHREHADAVVAYRTAQIERLTAFLEDE